MRFLASVADALAAAPAILASPLLAASGFDEVAGSVVTNTSVTYYMNHLYDIKLFAEKGDNSFYPVPLTYDIKAGFTCIFYLQVRYGPGEAIRSTSPSKLIGLSLRFL